MAKGIFNVSAYSESSLACMWKGASLIPDAGPLHSGALLTCSLDFITTCISTVLERIVFANLFVAEG